MNKGMELIGLPSIFKDSSGTSAIPAYLKITEHRYFALTIPNLLGPVCLILIKMLLT